MSESDTMFNEQDRGCAVVQLMRSTDPNYDNRTIASTLKMQIWIATNNRDVHWVIKKSFQLRLWSLVWFQMGATSCHLTSSKLAWKSTPKCTWMCWRVWWSPGAIRWPVADPRCRSRIQHRPTSPKRPRLGFRRSATSLYPSLTAPSSPDLNPLDCFVWSYVENITNMTSHNTKASLIAAIGRVFAELPPALVKKGMLPVPDPHRGGDWGFKVATLDRCQLYCIIKLPELIFFNKSFK